MYDPDKVHVIEERTYTELELSDLYEFWKKRCMSEDIEEAVDSFIDEANTPEMAAWLEANRSEIIRRLEALKPAFEDEQHEILSSHCATIFRLAQSKIREMYSESKR
jgi:hypothetical protein